MKDREHTRDPKDTSRQRPRQTERRLDLEALARLHRDFAVVKRGHRRRPDRARRPHGRLRR